MSFEINFADTHKCHGRVFRDPDLIPMLTPIRTAVFFILNMVGSDLEDKSEGLPSSAPGMKCV